jgi:hypothetical protein
MEMNNERRADCGESAIYSAGMATGVVRVEDVETAITDVLAYIAHFCDRCGLDAESMFKHGIQSYSMDCQDGPLARTQIPHHEPLVRQLEEI